MKLRPLPLFGVGTLANQLVVIGGQHLEGSTSCSFRYENQLSDLYLGGARNTVTASWFQISHLQAERDSGYLVKMNCRLCNLLK